MMTITILKAFSNFQIQKWEVILQQAGLKQKRVIKNQQQNLNKSLLPRNKVYNLTVSLKNKTKSVDRKSSRSKKIQSKTMTKESRRTMMTTFQVIKQKRVSISKRLKIKQLKSMVQTILFWLQWSALKVKPEQITSK